MWIEIFNNVNHSPRWCPVRVSTLTSNPILKMLLGTIFFLLSTTEGSTCFWCLQTSKNICKTSKKIWFFQLLADESFYQSCMRESFMLVWRALCVCYIRWFKCSATARDTLFLAKMLHMTKDRRCNMFVHILLREILQILRKHQKHFPLISSLINEAKWS